MGLQKNEQTSSFNISRAVKGNMDEMMVSGPLAAHDH
jgi:hypothetical protein